MVRTLLIGLVASSLVACQGARIPVQSGLALGEVVEPAIVSIYAWHHDGENPTRMQGTAFFVGPDLVATNYHVVEGASRATVRFADGFDVQVTGVVGDDAGVDLVVLRLARASDVDPLTLASEAPQPGTSIRAVGSPDGLAQTVVKGNVGSRVLSFDVLDEAVMMTASIRPGMSGAPVLDSDGAVVGVLSRGTNVERQSYMVPAGRLAQIEHAQDATPLDLWNESRAREPENIARNRFGEAASAFEQGKFEQSIRLLRASIDAGLSDAGKATAWYVIGDALSNLGRDDDAINAYHRAIHLKPRHALSHAALGAAFRRQHRTAAALASYADALDLMPGSASFNVGLGWAHFQSRAFEPAYEAFRRAVQLEPETAAGWAGVAATCLELERAGDARDYALHAIALQPEDSHGYWVLASAHTRLGAWDDAATALERGLRLEPGHAPALFALGRARLMLGDRTGATEQRRQLRGRDPHLASRLSSLIDDDA